MIIGRRCSHQGGGHRPAETESFHANLFGLHIGQGLQPFGPFDKVAYLNGIQVFIDSIQSRAAVVPGGTAVGHQLDDSVLGIPGIGGGVHPAVVHQRRVGTAVDVHMHRILPGRIEALRIIDDTGELQAVHRDGDQFSGVNLTGTEVRTSLAGNALRASLEVMQTQFPGRFEVGAAGDEMLTVRGEGGDGHVHRRVGKGCDYPLG